MTRSGKVPYQLGGWCGAVTALSGPGLALRRTLIDYKSNARLGSSSTYVFRESPDQRIALTRHHGIMGWTGRSWVHERTLANKSPTTSAIGLAGPLFSRSKEMIDTDSIMRTGINMVAVIQSKYKIPLYPHSSPALLSTSTHSKQ